jgi:hypothetical protein
MDRVVSAASRKIAGLASSSPLIELLASASELVESAPSEIVSSTYVSIPVESIVTAYELADFVQHYATEHAVLASIELGDTRLRVRFCPLPTKSREVIGG